MSELRIIAERIKKRIGVRGIASRFGFDYSEVGDRARYPCPICRESSSSKRTVSVFDADDGAERWHCFSCDVGGDCISWLAARLDCQPYESIRRLAGMLGVTVDDDALLGFLTDSIRDVGDSVASESTARSSVRAVRAEWWRWRNANPDAGSVDVLRRLPVVDLAETKARNGADRVASAVREILARPTGEIPKPGDSRESSAMRRVFAFYNAALYSGECYEFLAHECVDPLVYVRDRKWMTEDVAPFSVGYCPLGCDVDDIGATSLEEAGVIYRRRGRPVRHAMEGRIVFPIKSLAGRVVAFAGRTVVNDDAKYLNTRESAAFSKGSVLFGMYENLPTIVAKKKVVVVEGYADVLAMRRLSYGIAIAAMGTAITPDHAEVLSRVADEVIVLLDGDKAGREGAERASSVLRSTRYALSIASLPAGVDPDEATPGQVRAALAAREPVDRPTRGPGVAWLERLLRRS